MKQIVGCPAVPLLEPTAGLALHLSVQTLGITLSVLY